MMLKKLSLYASLIALSTGSLAAANYDPSNGQWRVIGEYLYWSPSVDDTYFVIDSPVELTPAAPNGSRKDLDLNFHSGYRIGGAYLFCDCNRAAQVTYTHLDFNKSKTVTGDFLWATRGTPDLTSGFESYAGTASASTKFKYQNIDAFYGQQLFECCGLDFGIQIGLEAAELKLNETYVYTSDEDTATVHQHSKTKAIGPKLGFAIGYDLFESRDCDCNSKLSLNFLGAGSLLAADRKASIDDDVTAVVGLDVSDKKSWGVIPAFHARVGLDYDMSFACVNASLEIGYEFTSFINGLTRQTFADDVGDAYSFNQYHNFDMQGLYISGSVTF